MPLRLTTLLAALALGTGAAGPARADGAFPDEFSIHFPASAPDRIVVGANFGMMVSEDRGATWRYACEPWVTTESSDPLSQINVRYYQVSADGAVLADSTNGAITRSADVGCSWPRSGGSIAGLMATDVFASPTDANFVLAISVIPTGSSLWRSHDGGKSFDSPALYTSNVLLTGVEISKSSPAVVYATLSGPGRSQLVRSGDSGQTWTAYDLPKLASTPGQPPDITPQPRILAVDPEDADTLYLRLLGPPYDAVAIATQGGQAVEIALTITGAFSAFARGSDKSLYAGTPDGKLYVRPPQGAFAAPIKAPRFRCLGQGPGTGDLYACADMFQDGFSLGVSKDGGKTFQKVMSLPEMQGPLTCGTVQAACAAHWARIQNVFATDAGTGGTDAGATGGGGSQQSGGGHCASSGAGPWAVLGVLLLAARRRRPAN